MEGTLSFNQRTTQNLVYEIVGQMPETLDGKLFLVEFFTWPLLVKLCQKLAPDECGPNAADWYGENSLGCGLTAQKARYLARKLRDACGVCSEQGHASTLPTPILEAIAEICKESDGENELTIDKVWEFITFLENCGGFQVGLFSFV